MNVILFDDPVIRTNMLPLAFTRPLARMRIGILTIDEKWAKRLGVTPSFATPSYLAAKFPTVFTDDNWWISGSVCPDDKFVSVLHNLKPGDAIEKNGRILAARTHEDEIPEVIAGTVHSYTDEITIIDQLWKIFHQNGPQIRVDFELLTAGRTTHPIADKATVLYQEERIFAEEGVSVKAGILNAENGPIYLGKNTQIQEGAVIRGPFAILDRSIVNMGGKMRGDTTIGPDCKVGGEISNSVIFGCTNKAHDGFLGNSVLGEWCNNGADTNNSNKNNNYDVVKLWNYSQQKAVPTGLYFCGVIMGDHSKSGINTMFNTGTVVGVSSNVLGGGYQPNFIPSFSWGGEETYALDKAIATAERAMGRRSVPQTEADKSIMKEIFQLTSNERRWE